MRNRTVRLTSNPAVRFAPFSGCLAAASRKGRQMRFVARTRGRGRPKPDWPVAERARSQLRPPAAGRVRLTLFNIEELATVRRGGRQRIRGGLIQVRPPAE